MFLRSRKQNWINRTALNGANRNERLFDYFCAIFDEEYGAYTQQLRSNDVCQYCNVCHEKNICKFESPFQFIN